MTDNSKGNLYPALWHSGCANLSVWIRLAKVPLCFLVGCTTLFGYLLADPGISGNSLLAGFGVFCLAAGAATFNSIQEMGLDAKMERTKGRPLPQGRVTTCQATVLAVLLLTVGLLILLITPDSFTPFLAAAGAVVIYNFVYTPLKKKSVLAIVPGAVAGAMPPFIGWLAGGGDMISFTSGLLVALLILWQVPHYWLVLLNHKKDYIGGQLPHFLEQFQEASVKRFFCTWIGALAVVFLMFRLVVFNLGSIAFGIVCLNALVLLFVFVFQLVVVQKSNYKLLFVVLNMSLLLHMLAFTAGNLVS